MNDKIRILKSQVMAQDGKNVAYRDEGGTLRKSPAARVEIVESMDATPQEVITAGSSPLESAPLEHTDPVGVSEEVPPSSDKPPPSESGAPVQPTKTKPSRKTTMATATASTAAKKKVAPPKAKVAAKKAAPRTEASGIRTIGGKAVNLDNYEKVKAPGGGTSYHNGDAVAEKLNGKTLDEVYALASKHLKEDVKALRDKYKHLNVGMQRMSLGNRLRKVLIPKEAKN